MTLQLLNTEILVAKKQMECDGVRSYFDICDRYRGIREDFKLVFPQDIVVIARHKNGHIKPGMQYILREFVDTDTGEQYFLNILPDMDKVCLRNNIYRPIFSSLLKQ